jgi:hypothetical protein
LAAATISSTTLLVSLFLVVAAISLCGPIITIPTTELGASLAFAAKVCHNALLPYGVLGGDV